MATTTLRNELSALHLRFTAFIAELPSYFRLGSVAGLNARRPLEAIPGYRWMLQIQLWTLLVRLHRACPGATDLQAFTQLLAQNVISTQQHVKDRCTVCGSLSTNEEQVFYAALLLVVDLLCSPINKRKDDPGSSLGRLMVRDKINEAVDVLLHASVTDGSGVSSVDRLISGQETITRQVDVLRALLSLEEDNSRDQLNPKRTEASPRSSLRERLIRSLAIVCEQGQNSGSARTECQPETASDLLLPTLPSLDALNDINILPLLSDAPGNEFWQYLDFSMCYESPGNTSSSSTITSAVHRG